ncbi:tRNA-specific 2-thiouridylase, partial [Candidatus Fermentibacterales bacterium]|nr:tRNA-specific 2-thiouridylase [Candidatus Fermentibacterales bacterium]
MPEAPSPTGPVAVAVSGGIDSAVALGLCIESMGAARVRAVFLETGYSDRAAAERVASFFGADLEVLPVEDDFRRLVIEESLALAGRGLTPNPCAICNRGIKLGLLPERLAADETPATGHYVRHGPGGSVLRGLDSSRDQSYFLALVRGEDLRRCLFPLGELSRRQVLAESLRLGLWFTGGESSQDLCFPMRDGRGVRPREPGPIVYPDGRRIGTHRGLDRYTIGQRKGLGVSSGVPVYVSSLDPEANALIVTPLPAGGGSSPL